MAISCNLLCHSRTISARMSGMYSFRRAGLCKSLDSLATEALSRAAKSPYVEPKSASDCCFHRVGAGLHFRLTALTGPRACFDFEPLWGSRWERAWTPPPLRSYQKQRLCQQNVRTMSAYGHARAGLLWYDRAGISSRRGLLTILLCCGNILQVFARRILKVGEKP